MPEPAQSNSVRREREPQAAQAAERTNLELRVQVCGADTVAVEHACDSDPAVGVNAKPHCAPQWPLGAGHIMRKGQAAVHLGDRVTDRAILPTELLDQC